MNQSFTGRPWLLLGLLTTSLSLNLYMVTNRPPPTRPGLAETGATQPDTQSASVVSPAAGAVRVPVEVVNPAGARGSAVQMPVERDLNLTDPDWNVFDEEVTHSLARTFSSAESEHGGALSAIYSRLFHWDIDLRRDLRKGDRVQVAWKKGDDGIEISAASLTSEKLGKTLSAYRFTRSGDDFPSYWQKSGTEIARRLKESPLADYEMVTSLLKDRPTHAGMDFKTPIGVSVLATRSGTVTRTNWNTRANGNCIELRFSDGTLAKYLHLSKTGVRVGQRVQTGDVLGASGNTGRSTAPHLHYQLNKGNRVLDPIDVHGTIARSIKPGERNAFDSNVARLDALLGNALARR
jgi:murein DD-endopeptidase MepM/ murein hydrolase activator NlpD